MINISQHCFVPRGKTLQGVYSLSGTFSSNLNCLTTEKQIGDIYNCFQLFGSYVPRNYYVLRLYEPIISSQGANYVGVGNGNTGYVQPTLEKKSTAYSSSAFTSRNGRLFVSSVMWYEDSPSVPNLTLSSINEEAI